MNYEATCPLYGPEKRAGDAWLLLKEAEKNYFEPGRFTANLNAAITGLRSVTFVLQKNKEQIRDFAIWYGAWQDRMRASPILNWLVESRNKIEKQGDLETHSKARIGIYTSWLQPPILEIDVPPTATTAQIAHTFYNSKSHQHLPEGSLLKIERRWTESELKGREILDALTEVHTFLAALIKDAHSHLNNPDFCSWATSLRQPSERRPDCIGLNRVAWFDLPDLTPFTPGIKTVTVTREEAEKVAREHYSFEESIFAATKNAESLHESAKGWFGIAKAVLQRDGHHQPIALLQLQNEMRIVPLQMQDRAEKHLAVRMLGELAVKESAHAVFLINEVWTAVFDAKHPNRHAKDAPDRTEALMLNAADRSGHNFNCFLPFERRAGKIEFQTEPQFDEIPAPILQPIRDAWANH